MTKTFKITDEIIMTHEQNQQCKKGCTFQLMRLTKKLKYTQRERKVKAVKMIYVVLTECIRE